MEKKKLLPSAIYLLVGALVWKSTSPWNRVDAKTGEASKVTASIAATNEIVRFIDWTPSTRIRRAEAHWDEGLAVHPRRRLGARANLLSARLKVRRDPQTVRPPGPTS